MSHLFTVAGSLTQDLDEIANQLREQISALSPDAPQSAKQQLGIQTGAVEFLEVVRGNESPHTHPESDSIISVLEGARYVKLSPDTLNTPAGMTVVIPKAVCHAYYNTAQSASVLPVT